MKYYRVLMYIDSGELLAAVEKKWQGRTPKYKVGCHVAAVINYLRRECLLEQPEYRDEDIRMEEPRTSPGCKRYVYGRYTLVYDSSIGGVFLVYREATKDEVEYAEDNGLRFDRCGFRKRD